MTSFLVRLLTRFNFTENELIHSYFLRTLPKSQAPSFVLLANGWTSVLSKNFSTALSEINWQSTKRKKVIKFVLNWI